MNKNTIFRYFVYICCVLISFVIVTVNVYTQDLEPTPSQGVDTHPKSYTQFMRSFHTARIEGDVSQKNIMYDSFDTFINSEQEKLSSLSVDRKKVSAYLDRLRAMKTTFEVSTTETTGGSWWSRAWDSIQHFFSSDTPVAFESVDPTQIAVPEKPARFSFDDTIVSVKNLTNLSVSSHDAGRLSPKLLSLVQFEPALASSDSFPLVADIHASPEAPLSDRMSEEARSLHNNPVEIVNFVRNTILYEPYYGLKKGSEGCLAELSCNDADSAALTIDLLRSAGIPARFKSSVAVFSMESLKQMLGVDTPNLVYGVLAKNKVPVYIVSGNEYSENLMDSDLSAETEFGLEWIYVEMFYEYDERGANIENTLDLSQVSSTEELQTIVQQYPKKQWVPIDVTVRPTIHTKKNILLDQVSMDSENFFYTYLQYQGELSPIEKYAQDLQIASGLSVENSLSTKNLGEQYLSIIPITLPFVTAEGIDEEGNTIVATPYSSLPESLYHSVTISLKKSDTSEILLSHTYLPWEINNVETGLNYYGYDETDQGVIDTYGGIHATPAELVSLKASFTGSFSEIESQNPISIGDTLILEFSLTQDGQELYTDQKFSTAGNAEGIYISLSQVRDNPLLPTDIDRASSILLEGNGAIAREYLVHIAQEGKLLKQSLDYDYQTVFTRAVVTQNRVLQKVNGVPTTFDFKGLTIDATTYINDYSNRGIITDHTKDFRVLWGLMASQYEGQIFTDLAGLSGIATVQGLQYAYAHPQEYTVHVITASNESEIDALSLSSNTKANMHADVAEGNTIITPDKPVGEENWNGVLYISLDPQWTGTYAIGEQVSGNGGWTILGNKEIITLTDPGGNIVEQFKYTVQGKNFIFTDGSINTKNKLCSISISDLETVVYGEGWQGMYGLPCVIEHYNFGGHDHTLILTTNGAKFESNSDSYSFWKYEYQVLSLMWNALENYSIKPTDLYIYWGTYTYAKGNPNWDKQNKIDKLAVYNPKSQNVFVMSEKDMVQKYISPTMIAGAFVPGHLGFPTGNIENTTESFAGTKGLYQNFTNGQMYYKTSGFNKTFVVFGKIAEYYNNNNGTWGKFGFPLSDPFFIAGNEYLQKFEFSLLKQSLNTIIVVSHSDHDRRVLNREYGLKIAQQVFEGKISNIEGMALVADYLAFVTKNSEEFVKDFTVFYLGIEYVTQYQDIETIQKNLNKYVATNFWSDTGFKFKYNDSHYCMLPGKEIEILSADIINDFYSSNKDYICISNQPLHAMAGFNLSFFYGLSAALAANHTHDADYNTFGINHESLEDIWLGDDMAYLGYELKNWLITKEEVGEWLLQNIGDPNYISMRKSVQELIEESEYRKWFRIFEYTLHGLSYIFDNGSKWYYIKDIEKLPCNGKYYYYQEYQKLYKQGANLGKAKAIFDIDSKTVILLHGDLLNTYSNNNTICNNMDTLKNLYGTVLIYVFSDIAEYSWDN